MDTHQSAAAYSVFAHLTAEKSPLYRSILTTLVAERLGARCAPLVSVQGRYATPTRVLLRQLVAAGACLRYHGDFDLGGINIARRLFSEFPAEPWRFSQSDYFAAPKATRFHGPVLLTPWAPELVDTMNSDGQLVHEEAVFDSLLQDLNKPA